MSDHSTHGDFYDRQYNPRTQVPRFADYFARWKSAAAAARSTLECRLDVRYGSSGTETLDLFPAAGGCAAPPQRAPLLIFIHGGYWRTFDKSDFSWVAAPYVAAGIAVAVINYGLLPATPLRAIVDQIRRACAWLHLNGDRLGFARDRIVCSGHSAGGHLTAMALATAWPRFQPGLPDRILAGGVAISGLYDLAPLLRTEFLGRDLGLGEDEAHELSPLHAKSPPAAPLVLAVGAGESSEFHRQTAQMAASVPASIVGEILEVPGCDHFSVCDALARPGSTLFEATRALLESCRSIDEQRSAVTSGVPAAAEPRSVGHS